MVEENYVSSTEISDLTTSATKYSKADRSIAKTTGTLSVATKQKKYKRGNPCNKNTKIAPVASLFKGANLELRDKVFIKGPLQAAKYDEAYKSILTYI